MTKNKPLLLIVGKSGSGKTTIVKHLETYGLKTLQSYTTRKQRFEGETGHTFITDEEFENLENVVATTYFNSNYYCATKEQLDESDTYVIDLDGIEYFKEHYKTDRPIKIVYIKVPTHTLFIRLLKRDGLVKTIKRMKHDKKAFEGVENMTEITILNTGMIEYVVYDIIKLYQRILRGGENY